MKLATSNILLTALNLIAYTTCIYLFGALFVFDFSSLASPSDEDTFNGKTVMIGPRPRSWVPYASNDFDIPGGYGYSSENWPFIVWKPICLLFLKLNGYEKPFDWRK